MKTLVLNAGYEPISIVSYRRGIALVLAGKATVLANEDITICSAYTTMYQPSVVLLNRYVQPPRGRVTAVSRRGVLRRDKCRCAYCGAAANTVDHVLPRSRGGKNSWLNLVACCRTCNNVKGNRTPEEMGWKLLFTPKAPQTGRWWLRDIENPAERWLPFLELAQTA